MRERLGDDEENHWAWGRSFHLKGVGSSPAAALMTSGDSIKNLIFFFFFKNIINCYISHFKTQFKIEPFDSNELQETSIKIKILKKDISFEIYQ